MTNLNSGYDEKPTIATNKTELANCSKCGQINVENYYIDNKQVCSGCYYENIEKVINEIQNQHDAEVRADERKKVCEELQEWADKEIIKFTSSYLYRTSNVLRGRRIIDYIDLKQKLTELEKTPQGKGEKDE